MIELLAGLAAILLILLISAIVYALSYRQERDMAQRAVFNLNDEIFTLNGTIGILENRVTTLRGDNIALETQVTTLTDGFNVIAAERDALKAERVAEMSAAPARNPEGTIAFQPKRDSKGKFLPKPKTPKPPKTNLGKAPKPVACG
jgi:cbb3-type cytochrome oxidase subunit 3